MRRGEEGFNKEKAWQNQPFTTPEPEEKRVVGATAGAAGEETPPG